ncbi:MAG: DUF1640 domain-containing protein [Rhodoferax sp.]|nr:DUF1640 domain-containing protein [Rhodoferax sp.]
MSTVTFDTLKFSNTLKAAGVPDKQAEAQAAAVALAIGEVDVATKRDIADLRTYLDARMAGFDAKLESMELRLTIKLGAFLVVAVGVIVTLLKH